MRLVALALIAGLAGASCTTEEAPAVGERDAVGTPPAPERNDVGSAGWETVERALGGQVYVPIYSHIYFRDSRRELDLAATLSIRNADYTVPVYVTGVRYYDSDGALVRRYLDAPRAVGPMGSTAFIIDQRDDTGGVGANFIVEWHAEEAVVPPVIEAVMIGTASAQGISFVTQGRVLQRALAPAPPPPGATEQPTD